MGGEDLGLCVCLCLCSYFPRPLEASDSVFSSVPQVVLHFMVGSPSAAVSQDLAQLLSQAGLMKR